MKKEWIAYVAGGAAVGAAALALFLLGNPLNMGFCTACFQRDISGALGLHSFMPGARMRIELLGVVAGAFALALARREFKPKAGSAPMLMFAFGTLMMAGALVFLGCPVRMFERLAAGDLNAMVGLAGLFAGAAGGTLLLKFRFQPPEPKKQSLVEGIAFTAASCVLIATAIAAALGASIAFKAGTAGPAAMFPGASPSPAHAFALPLPAGAFVALAIGAVIGAASQWSRFCSIGWVRDLILARDVKLLLAVLALSLVYGVGSVATGHFKAGFSGQPIAHAEHIWNFLGLALVGLCGALANGCPLRLTVRAASGDSDAGAAVLGLFAGAAISHNFDLAAAPKGVPASAQAVVVLGILAVVAIGFFSRAKQ